MDPSFGVYQLPEEHDAAPRRRYEQLAEERIAPQAAEIDETGEFPWDVYKSFAQADLHAIHLPESYGGAGADSIATVIVIEEVARVCASSSLIPAVNKLGTMPLLLAGSEELKACATCRRSPAATRCSPTRLSEREAGSDAAAMKDAGGARR